MPRRSVRERAVIPKSGEREEGFHLHFILRVIMSVSLLMVFSAMFPNPSSALASDVESKSQKDSPLTVDYVISEPCSLVAFMDTISGRAHTTEWVKDWFFKRRTTDAGPAQVEKERRLCQSYRDVFDRTSNETPWADETGRECDFNQRVLCLAARSSTLAELLEKVKAMTKSSDCEVLKSVFEYFDPIYRSYVWEPRLTVLERQLREFKEESLKSRMSERLDQVKRFMKAPWVENLPFTIVLVPLVYNGPSTHGESLGALQIVELRPEE